MLNRFLLFAGEAGIYSIAGAALLAIVIFYVLIRTYVLKISELKKSVRPASPAKKPPPTPEEARGFTRKTDLMDQLSPEGKKIHRQAEELVKLGDLRQAARLFVSIGFQRRAIDILEHNGFIDEACHILMDMKAVHRAGALYERNGMLLNAAQCYEQANHHVQAGKAYHAAAYELTDPALLKKALLSYEKAAKFEEFFDVCFRLNDIPELVRVAKAQRHYSSLLKYCKLPLHTKAITKEINPYILEHMVTDLKPFPGDLITLAHLLTHMNNEGLYRSILELSRTKQLLEFWEFVPEETAIKLCQYLAKSPFEIPKETLKSHGEAMMQFHHQKAGSYILSLVKALEKKAS